MDGFTLSRLRKECHVMRLYKSRARKIGMPTRLNGWLV